MESASVAFAMLHGKFSIVGNKQRNECQRGIVLTLAHESVGLFLSIWLHLLCVATCRVHDEILLVLPLVVLEWMTDHV